MLRKLTLSALLALTTTAALGFVASPAHADEAEDGVIETVETPEGTVPEVVSGREIVPRGCSFGNQTSTIHKTLGADDGGASGITWNFRINVYRQVCTNVTIVESVTVSYWITGSNADRHCSIDDFGVDKVKINAGDVGGWNVPTKTWNCTPGDLSKAYAFQAPNGTQINLGGGDRVIGGKATKARVGLPDDNYTIPAVTLPKP